MKIEPGTTSSAQEGSYPIKFQLIDELGILSDKLTYTLDIVPEEVVEDSSIGFKYASILE